MLLNLRTRHFKNVDFKLTNKNILILFHFFPDILIGIGWASIHKTCVELLPTQWLSFEQLSISLFLILACTLWKNDKFRANTIKIFQYLSIFEIAIGILLAVLMIFSFNVWVYAIGSLALTGLVSVFLTRAEIAFKSKLFADRERENFDNDMELACSASSLIGFAIATVLPVSLNVALLLWAISWTGNIGWLMVYYKNRKKLEKII